MRSARNTPRRRIPTSPKSFAPSFFSMISCTSRTSVRSISDADINWAFWRRLGRRTGGLEDINAASYAGQVVEGKKAGWNPEIRPEAPSFAAVGSRNCPSQPGQQNKRRADENPAHRPAHHHAVRGGEIVCEHLAGLGIGVAGRACGRLQSSPFEIRSAPDGHGIGRSHHGKYREANRPLSAPILKPAPGDGMSCAQLRLQVEPTAKYPGHWSRKGEP